MVLHGFISQKLKDLVHIFGHLSEREKHSEIKPSLLWARTSSSSVANGENEWLYPFLMGVL